MLMIKKVFDVMLLRILVKVESSETASEPTTGY